MHRTTHSRCKYREAHFARDLCILSFYFHECIVHSNCCQSMRGIVPRHCNTSTFNCSRNSILKLVALLLPCELRLPAYRAPVVNHCCWGRGHGALTSFEEKDLHMKTGRSWQHVPFNAHMRNNVIHWISTRLSHDIVSWTTHSRCKYRGSGTFRKLI